MLQERTKSKTIFSNTLLDDAETLKRQLVPFKKTFSSLALLIDPQRRKNKQVKLQEKEYRQELAEQYFLLAELLGQSNTIEDLITNVTNSNVATHQKFNENLAKVDEQLMLRRQEIKALDLAFTNAGANTKIHVFPIDKSLFLESPDPQYWERLKYLLRKLFYAYKMLDCPCYLGFCFPIESANKATEVAEFMSEFVGISAIDVPVHLKSDDLKEFMDESFNIVNPNDELAHLIISGTHAYVKGVYENSVQKKMLPIPLGPAFIGKLLSAAPGVYFTGLSGSPIKGIDSVVCEYDFERIDSSEFDKRGVVLILDSGNVQGTGNPYNGDVVEFTSFLTMDVFVLLNRSLIQFANLAAHGSWGIEEEENLRDKLVNYFNKLTRSKVIERGVLRDLIVIEYDEEEKSVQISIPIKYKGVVNSFIFKLEGEKGNLKLAKEN